MFHPGKKGPYYKQQLHYIQHHNLRTDVKKMFCEDLCAVLWQWRALGDRIILMIDANDIVLDGTLSNMLAEEGIEMKEAVHSRMPVLNSLDRYHSSYAGEES